MPPRRQTVGDSIAGSQLGQPEIGILVNGDRTISPGLARHQVQASLGDVLERLFTVTRLHTFALRLNPDLQ